jgi:hypothetical protein
MSTVSIIGNNLVVTCDNTTETIPIWELCVDNCCSVRFHLTRKFRILNALFTYPQSYSFPPARPILPGTIFSSSYVSTSTPSIDCPYLVWNEKELQNRPLSRVLAPRKEIIELYQTNYKYRISYRTNHPIQFLNLIRVDAMAYPLVDAKGNTLCSLVGEGSFYTIAWSVFVVKLVDINDRNDLNAHITIEAVEEVIPLASLVGDICLNVETEKCGTVSVKVATKFDNSQSNERFPVRELEGLSNTLFGLNRLQSNRPCFGQDLLTIPPPGPFAVLASTDPGLALNVQLVDLQPTDNDNLHFTFGAVPQNQILDIVNPLQGIETGNGIYLKYGISEDGQGGVTYKISYRIVLLYQSLPMNDLPSFYLAGGNVGFFNEYAKLCEIGGALTDTIDTRFTVRELPNGQKELIFEGTMRFTTLLWKCTFRTFIVGIHPGDGVFMGFDPSQSRLRIEVDPDQYCRSANLGPCG